MTQFQILQYAMHGTDKMLKIAKQLNEPEWVLSLIKDHKKELLDLMKEEV